MSNGVKALMDVPSQREAIRGRDPQWEIPDPVPVALPVGAERPPTIQEMLKLYLANDRVQQELADEDFETFEEADDFEPDEEDMLYMSGFEVHEYEMEDDEPPAEPDEDPPAEPAVERDSDDEVVTPSSEVSVQDGQ